VIPAGITTTEAASTRRRLKLRGVQRTNDAGQMTHIYRALATKQKWTSSKASRENLRL